jgi:hypothetical protein
MQCPDYNQKEFEKVINEKLVALNIRPDDVSQMDPYDAIMLAVKITTDSIDYLNVDSTEYRREHGYKNLIELLKEGLGDCDSNTRIFIGIAYYFKTLNPKLINFHFVEGDTIGGQSIRPTWPGVLIACTNKNSKLILKYTQIDPTFFDNRGDLQAEEGYHFTHERIRSDLGIE